MLENNEVKVVKISGENYLLNGIITVPKVDGNSDYELIKKWIEEGNIYEPEFTEEEIEVNKLNKQIKEAQSYLSLTDWIKDYKLRNDLGLELIPKDSTKWEVIKKREEYIDFLKLNLC